MQSADLPLEISVDETHSLLELSGEAKLRLLDCREDDEWQICHIQGAELVPLSQFGELAPLRLANAEPAQRIIVYCHHGMRSLRATMWLRQKGFSQVQSMSGGIEAWAEQVDPEMARY